jgi:hypothetical protein
MPRSPHTSSRRRGTCTTCMSGRILAMDSVLVAPCADENLSSGVPGRRLVSWEHAAAQPAPTIVIGHAPGRRRSCCWCCLHRCGPIHRFSHRRPFIVRQLAEFADSYRPRSPWRLASPGQRCAVHRPWPGTASALGPQAASRRAGQQVNPQVADLARRHPQVPAHNQRAALATGSRDTPSSRQKRASTPSAGHA